MPDAEATRKEATIPPDEWAQWPDERLLDLRINQLGVTIEGSVLEERLAELSSNLEARGLTMFSPHFWLSANWFDLARELTERWHHQQQIRLAVGDPADAIMTPELYHPVLDCFMRALPFHYRSQSAPPGTGIAMHVSGDCGGDWHLYRSDRWMLVTEPAGTLAATVTIPQDIAWRIFTKGIARDAARERISLSGDTALGDHVLDMLAIVG